LFAKLLGIQGTFPDWFISFLADRKQKKKKS
jgi:hypothetical protein